MAHLRVGRTSARASRYALRLEAGSAPPDEEGRSLAVDPDRMLAHLASARSGDSATFAIAPWSDPVPMESPNDGPFLSFDAPEVADAEVAQSAAGAPVRRGDRCVLVVSPTTTLAPLECRLVLRCGAELLHAREAPGVCLVDDGQLVRAADSELVADFERGRADLQGQGWAITLTLAPRAEP